MRPSPRETMMAWFSGSVRVRCHRPSLITYALIASADFLIWLYAALSLPLPSPKFPKRRVPSAVAADVMARQRAMPRGVNVTAETGPGCLRSTSTSSSQRWKRSRTGRVSKAHCAMRLRLSSMRLPDRRADDRRLLDVALRLLERVRRRVDGADVGDRRGDRERLRRSAAIGARRGECGPQRKAGDLRERGGELRVDLGQAG